MPPAPPSALTPAGRAPIVRGQTVRGGVAVLTAVLIVIFVIVLALLVGVRRRRTTR